MHRAYKCVKLIFNVPNSFIITSRVILSHPKNLDDLSDNGDIELVKYLPQGYFERLTNEISSIEEFRREIENVVFTHLSDDAKIGFTSFDELVKSKKELINHEINNLKDRLQPLNSNIFEKFWIFRYCPKFERLVCHDYLAVSSFFLLLFLAFLAFFWA